MNVKVAEEFRHQCKVSRSRNPLLPVFGWELRRLLVRRVTWAITMLVFFIFCAAIWLIGPSTVVLARYFPPYGPELTSSGMSVWSLSSKIPNLLLLLFGLIPPLLNIDLVSADLRRRTHEILMATSIPSWAFLWGRYLAGLISSLGLAIVMLLAILLMAYQLTMRHGYYPSPNVGALTAIWAITVLPATILLSGLSFALGTLLPRFRPLVGACLLAGWFASAPLASSQTAILPSQLVFDPQSTVMAQSINGQYRHQLFTGVGQITDVQQVSKLQEKEYVVEQQMPDLWPWLPSKILYIGLGLTAVAIAVARFRRFSNTLATVETSQKSSLTIVLLAAEPTHAGIRDARDSTMRQSSPVILVLTSELQRLAGQHRSWVFVGLAFACFLLLTTFQQDAYRFGIGGASGPESSYVVPGSTGWGILTAIPTGILPLLGLALPFLTANLVSRDLHLRTRELFMATSIPSWAYVLGRYLAGLLISLGLALLMLVAILTVGEICYLWLGYPPPTIPAILETWAVIVLPAVIFLSGASFAIATLLPRLVNLIQVAVGAGWTFCVLYLNRPLDGSPMPSYYVWDPTGKIMSQLAEAPYWDAFYNNQAAIREVEQRTVDLWPWVGIHAAWAAGGLALVLLAALSFRRFRGLR